MVRAKQQQSGRRKHLGGNKTEESVRAWTGDKLESQCDYPAESSTPVAFANGWIMPRSGSLHDCNEKTWPSQPRVQRYNSPTQ